MQCDSDYAVIDVEIFSPTPITRGQIDTFLAALPPAMAMPNTANGVIQRCGSASKADEAIAWFASNVKNPLLSALRRHVVSLFIVY